MSVRIEHRAEVLDSTLYRLVLRQHLLLDRIEHAVEPAQHCERQHHSPVLGLSVVPSQQIGHRPDEGGVVVDTLACHEGFPSRPDIAPCAHAGRPRMRSTLDFNLPEFTREWEILSGRDSKPEAYRAGAERDRPAGADVTW